MKKTVLVEAIRKGIAFKVITSKTGLAFLPYFAEYLERLKIPYDEKYDFWRIDDYMPEIIVAAFEQMRTGTDPLAQKYAARYKAQMSGEEVPNITDLGTTYGLEQVSAISSIASDIATLMAQPWLKDKIETYCFGQRTVLQQTFDKFSRRVYQRGLSKIVGSFGGRGMNGKFGKTELRKYDLAGRIMFTFARKKGDEEVNVSFVGEDGDPLLLSAGEQSCNASFREALDMIEEVILRWPLEPLLQKKIFKGNSDVKLDVVAAVEAANAK